MGLYTLMANWSVCEKTIVSSGKTTALLSTASGICTISTSGASIKEPTDCANAAKGEKLAIAIAANPAPTAGENTFLLIIEP